MGLGGRMTMQETYLFIGGSRDGQWRKIEKEEHLIRLQMDMPAVRLDDPIQHQVRLPPIEVYRRTAFTHGANQTMFYVYCINDVTGDDMLRMLVDGYRRPKNGITNAQT